MSFCPHHSSSGFIHTKVPAHDPIVGPARSICIEIPGKSFVKACEGTDSLVDEKFAKGLSPAMHKRPKDESVVLKEDGLC